MSSDQGRFAFNRWNNTILLAVLGFSSFFVACGGGSTTQVLHVSVANTQNPLVAQFTVKSGCTGQVMVQFGPDTTYGRSTSWYPVSAGQAVDIQVAGMRASSTYHMQAQRQCPGIVDTSQDLTFRTTWRGCRR